MIKKIRKNMKFIIFILIFIIICYCCYSFNYNMNNLPKGEYIDSIISPDGNYVLKSYLCNQHATVDFAIRVEIVDNKNNKSKNIYWSYHEREANMKWIDENTVEINDKILNIHKDVYDWRKNR